MINTFRDNWDPYGRWQMVSHGPVTWIPQFNSHSLVLLLGHKWNKNNRKEYINLDNEPNVSY